MRVTGKALVRVKLEVLIDAKGKVRKVSVIKSAGQLFDESAVNAMWASTFEPGKIDGKRVTVLMRTYVNFKLQ